MIERRHWGGLGTTSLIAFALSAGGCSSSSNNGGAPGSAGSGASGSPGTSGASGSGTAGSGTAGGGAVGGGSNGCSVTPASVTTTAKQVAAQLGKSNFLIGMGNDLNNDHSMDGAYTLGTKLDVHYAYLVGLMGQGGWPDWNTGGTFVNILTDSAQKAGVTPMFTLYSMAAQGENNLGVLTQDSYMQPYWDGAKLLFQRIAAFGGPALVQFEPDFWGYLQLSQSDPANIPVHVKALAPDCGCQPDTAVGMGNCLVILGRKYAPNALVGFHVSVWGNSDAGAVATFMTKLGADKGDFVTTDTLDRDAGCFEAGNDSHCQGRGTTGFYWDETNTTSPNFHDHLAWVKTITDSIGRPMLWWQTPFGVPSNTPGGTPGHYRDNRVHYIFGHISEFIAAGGVGAVFGTGSDNQTYITSDNDQFKNAVAAYFAAPVAL